MCFCFSTRILKTKHIIKQPSSSNNYFKPGALNPGHRTFARETKTFQISTNDVTGQGGRVASAAVP